MGIYEIILQRIKEEISKDPDKLGYAGKSDLEIFNLIMQKVVKQEVVTVEYPQPMLRIIDSIANGPNLLTKEDITNARKLVI